MTNSKLPVSKRQRALLFIGLLSAFAVQTALIYSDDTGERTPPLSLSAQNGKKVWLENNCQSCHQIYGFGGFLGPDLTNRGANFPAAALKGLLAAGPGAMPQIFIDDQESRDLAAFFRELKITGRSQPRIDLDGHLPWFEYKRQGVARK